MPRVSEIKRGQVIEHDGKVFGVRQIDRSAPTARGGGTLYRFKLESIPGGDRKEVTLKGDDMLKDADLVRRQCEFSYRDGNQFVFMDSEDFSQYLIDADVIGDGAGYITDGLQGIYVMIIDDTPVAIQLPQSVVLEVSDTAPVMKGATATKSNKPASLETGLEILVPDYITPGETVRVNTETGEFMGRA
ncbi:elongation factor P-like protein YeiP [Wenzhouxiangella sp. XN201]|uniref:elongation factor P-like protein EfpL n=1 Tax=Wenzhouxiangella sp. XN201 TaxID=2710755 RepID=UPI0013CA4754|nr:elongation factor P-like protein YeiP [Wenzhouxiangella sp. XN201]NEZ03554.1 elongation factor P-like protein YeiP [Wenzhouxiangella sp. XN201]